MSQSGWIEADDLTPESDLGEFAGFRPEKNPQFSGPRVLAARGWREYANGNFLTLLGLLDRDRKRLFNLMMSAADEMASAKTEEHRRFATNVYNKTKEMLVTVYLRED